MTMSRKTFLRSLVCMLLALPLVAVAQGENDEEPGDRSGEELMELTLEQVPPMIMAKARSAAPDVFFESAVSYWDEDFRVYRVTGRLFREIWNVFVRDDGKLLRTESDTQDD